jgi:hypothetical protein
VAHEKHRDPECEVPVDLVSERLASAQLGALYPRAGQRDREHDLQRHPREDDSHRLELEG